MVFWGAWRTSAVGRWLPGAALPVCSTSAFLPLALQRNRSGSASVAPMARFARHRLGRASEPSGGVEAAQAEVIELQVDWFSQRFIISGSLVCPWQSSQAALLITAVDNWAPAGSLSRNRVGRGCIPSGPATAWRCLIPCSRPELTCRTTRSAESGWNSFCRSQQLSKVASRSFTGTDGLIPAVCCGV